VTECRPLDLNRINSKDFDVLTIDDEIRVDALCASLLLAVRDRLLSADNSDPFMVGELCQGADYFLREFIIAECADNLLRLPPERIGQFAGHWYIIRTLEPNTGELATILSGIAACYRVLAEAGLVETRLAEEVTAACAELPVYSQRIDDFWAITDDGFDRWRAACPLPPRRI